MAAALLVATVVACGAPSTDPTRAPGDRAPLIPPRKAATLEALLGPWQPVPFQLDPAFHARAEAACRAEMVPGPGPEIPRAAGPTVATVDARGGAVVIVRSRGADMAVCHALQLLPSGDFAGAGSGQSGPWMERAPSGPWALEFEEAPTVEGGGLTVEGWSIHGRAGPGITLVIVRPVLGQATVATLENGWFAAWWPAPIPSDRANPPLHFTIQAYDAAGELRATLTQ